MLRYSAVQFYDQYHFFYIILYAINRSMENIIIDYIQSFKHTGSNISKVHYQSAGNILVTLHEGSLSFYSYHNKNSSFEHISTQGPIEELQNTQILLLEWLVDEECVACVGKDGNIFTVSKEGEVNMEAQNEDGIIAASVSPTQQYLYVVTKNKSLIQLNKQFDGVNEIALDEAEEVVANTAQFTWRADGSYFILNYETINGHKAVTKDVLMANFISPSKSDPKEDGLVQSVSEKGKKNMLGLVSWQPSGSIVAGVDYQLKGEQKLYRVIFWQKNGLRHLEFSLKNNVSEVLDMFWSLDSSVLFLRVKTTTNEYKLLFYYRANYHWFLKSVLDLKANDICLSLSCEKNKKHKLLIVGQSDFQIVEYGIRHSEKLWKNLADELQSKYEFQYFIDGDVLNVTDLSKCLMPPPMSMFKHQFESDIVGFSKFNSKILVITSDKLHLLDLASNERVSLEKGDLKDERIYGVQLLSANPIRFNANGYLFEVVEGKIQKLQKQTQQELIYILKDSDPQLKFRVSHENQQLKVNGNILSEQCTSFVFYHEFLLFTVSTSDMYDKLFVVNLVLDAWVQQQGSRFKEKLSEFQSKDLLNHRLIERGSKIIAICEGRVVFQLPRGNLEGIYPKIIMINQVQKKIAKREYRCAFEIIRTHKLDFNLLYDLNPEQFFTEIEAVLKDIKRVDFINLLVSQISDAISSELQYALSTKKLEEFAKDFEINMKGKKVKSVCRAVSETLRRLDKKQYILSIFTSDIREGRLNEVLFEIKQLKQNDVEIVTPPHLLVKDQIKKQKKKMSSQEILEYVCWLVDANAIYEAALLTYDLQLAAMTARCTQKDPKEYIPYIEGLKQIQNQIQFRKKICLDLKRYEIAVRQLSQGSPQQINQSLELIKAHKLFKHGLIIYAGKEQLRRVKELIIEQLCATGQVNEAYRVCQSIGEHKRALQFAKQSMDTKKIKECLEIIYSNRDDRVKVASQLINSYKEEIKNKVDLARLYVYIGEYQDAVAIYLRHNDYRKAYKYLWNVGEQFREKEMKKGFSLCFSVKRNDIIRDKKDFLEKYSRLLKVHKHKEEFGVSTSFKPRENDDMYSEVSVNSKSQSNYTISTTTGMRKKKDKKRSILSRNVKEGSLLEQEYLLAYIKSLEEKVEDNVKDAKLLIQHLICMNLVEEAEILRDEVRDYIATFNTYPIKSYARTKFEELHPQASELYYEQRKFSALSIDSFNYLF